MPIYDYRCEDCGAVAEFRLSHHDEHPGACPSCGHGVMERLLSASYMIRMGVPSSCGTCCEPSTSCQSAGCPSGGECHRDQ